MHAYSSMLPVSPPAAGAVLAEAERIVAGERDRELERGRRKARRKALQGERQRLAREERERKAAERRERDGRLRAAADGQRLALAEQVRERGAACGGSVAGRVFADVPDPRDPRGVRHSRPSVLALVLMAVLRGHASLAAVTGWIARADQELLAAAGARALPDGTRVPPCARTELPRVSRTGIWWLFHAASWPFRYSSRTSCGVL